MRYLHRTKEGTLIPVSKLTDKHLRYILKHIEITAEKGLILRTKVAPMRIEDIYTEERIEEDWYVGEEVKEIMNYDIYLMEAKKRGIEW